MFKHWSYDDEHEGYKGTRETANSLPAGLYQIELSPYDEPVAKRKELKKDRLASFASGPATSVLREINNFWDSKSAYAGLGVSHKRGILLHGPPGCGKSGILTLAIQDTVNRGGIVLELSNPRSFHETINLVRQIEDGRPILSTVEDIEKLLHQEHQILEIMDGATAMDGILFLATTNNLRKIPHRIRSRPSRIDTLIEVSLPCEEQRLEYLRFIVPHTLDKRDSFCVHFAAETNGFSLAQLKELVLGIVVYGHDSGYMMAKLSELGKEEAGEPAGNDDEEM
jgi:hypothetical protein